MLNGADVYFTTESRNKIDRARFLRVYQVIIIILSRDDILIATPAHKWIETGNGSCGRYGGGGGGGCCLWNMINGINELKFKSIIRLF